MNVFGYKVDWRLILWVVLAILIGHLIKGQMDGFEVKVDGETVYTGVSVNDCFTKEKSNAGVGWTDAGPEYWTKEDTYHCVGKTDSTDKTCTKKTSDECRKSTHCTPKEWTSERHRRNDNRNKLCKDAWKRERTWRRKTPERPH